jgi:ABC-2 type transport system ATP-binding protein
MPVLEINNLTKRYGKITALNNLSLTIEAGHVYGILGPNGSGKTTTLGIILGVLAQDDGSFSWFGDKYGANPRKEIGAILETPNFYPYLNAAENLDIVRVIKDLPPQNYDEILKIVNLYERRKSKFRTYSLGMKQRLAIGATLIGSPQVVIFDEPTNGLDPEGIAEVRTILQNVASSGKTVLMASHILDEVEKVCSHVAIIKNGNLLATGTVGSILSSDMTVEVMSTDAEKLRNVLQESSFVKKIYDHKDFLECAVDQSLDTATLSQHLHDKGVILTHLVSRKKRLEEEFLEITQTK